jgi:molybdate/tungstate transport system substrate-binding protein
MRAIHPLWVGLLALACILAGALAGYELRGGPAPSASPPGSPILSLTAAGTLGSVFPRVASVLANESPGVQAPLVAQQYQGSLAALAAITKLHGTYDVAAAADLRLIPSLLEPGWASWEIVFASSPVVLAYDPGVAALTGINSTNWASRIQGPGILLGVANASVDPNGYNAIFALELQGLVFNGSLDAVYGHFFTTPPGSLAVANPATTRVLPETQVATLLKAHQIQAALTYEAYAVSQNLSYVDLDSQVDLGSFDAALVSGYQRASTTILTGNTTVVQAGFPVAFAVTVPSNAPNATLGQLFVHLLLSPEGIGLLESHGFVPLVPAQADRITALPALLRPDVVPLDPVLVQGIG